MTEENQTTQINNTVATVALVFSIVGLLFLVSVILSPLGAICLFLGFILGIIGLFKAPRGKAVAAIIISILPGLITFVAGLFLWNSIKTPANEFMVWAQAIAENPQYSEILNDESAKGQLSNAIQSECKIIFSQITEEGIDDAINTYSGENTLEKGSYLFFDYIETCTENALNNYDQYTLESNVIESEVADNNTVAVNEEEIIAEVDAAIETIDNTNLQNTEEENIEEVIDILSAE